MQHGCFTGSLSLLDDEKIGETCTSMQSTEYPLRTDISVEEMQGWLEAIYIHTELLYRFPMIT